MRPNNGAASRKSCQPRSARRRPPRAVPSKPRSRRDAICKSSERQRGDLDAWLRARGLAAAPLILIQIGNKRTMRRGLRRLAVNHKYWPNERWAEVLRHVRQRHPDHAIVLLGTGPEYALNQEVAALADVGRLHNAADDLPIPRLVALLARAAGLITVDSGPAHAAAAVGCPLVVLFGKALPSLYRPWGTAGADVKVLCGEVAGRARYAGNRRAQRDRGMVRFEIARLTRPTLRRDAGSSRLAPARSMSCVTSTTPRLVTKKRCRSTAWILADLACRRESCSPHRECSA